MCAIIGAISANEIDIDILRQMRDRMAHRGPDNAGLWASATRRVCLGHRRLSIVDLSPEANQPFTSADGRFVVTFNGEIYNFRSLRDDLSRFGTRFRTRSDTEVLVEAYRRWGRRCVDHLSGMYAFAVWDTKERRLFCARDRAGEKPFYYFRSATSFVFASELKALLLWPEFRREMDYTALIDFLSLGFVAEPKSIWKDCRKLAAGHSLTVETDANGAPSSNDPVAYWDMQFSPDYSVADWTPRILDTLERAGREMAFADVPVGTFLSGGVDSSSVTAALSRAGCQVKTFTVGFDDEGFDERPYARRVALQYQTDHTERDVNAADLIADFEHLLWHYDEPFNDYSYLPTYQVCREARKNITVALSGDGGDEVFAGYGKYQRLGLRQEVDRFLPRPLSRVIASGVSSFTGGTNSFRRTLFQHTADAPAMLLDMLTLGLSSSALMAVARGELKEALKNYSPMDLVGELLAKAPPGEVGLVNAMRYLDLKLTLAGDILVKVDRASMAVSLEVRPVYLHRDILSLAERIPAELLADRNHSKEVLKSALRAWLPESILYRRKQGFAMPLKRWLNGSLQSAFTANGSSRLDDLLDPCLADRAISAHATGKADMTAVIHSLFFLNHWVAKWA